MGKSFIIHKYNSSQSRFLIFGQLGNMHTNYLGLIEIQFVTTWWKRTTEFELEC